MKKICVIFMSLAFSLICIFSLDLYIKKELNSNINKAIYYNNIYTRNCSDYMMDLVIDENSIVVLGSSELGASDTSAYPPVLFNYGCSDFNMILMGAGYLQSLSQAINVGALQNNIKNGKVALIISPQWFTKGHISSDMFSSRFEEANFVEFLKNDSITKKTKIAVAERVNELLAADQVQLERVKKFEDIYLYHSLNPVKHLEMFIYEGFSNAKIRFELLDELKDRKDEANYKKFVYADSINFKELLEEAENIGKNSCTNNEYGVYDEYFDTYIRADYEEYKDSNSEVTYTDSKEYDDLRLFLDVCNETGIEPLIISVPVNGRWYDYTGFSKTDRQQYYQNIRDICAEYDVKLADFSDKEYEMYFLKDIMHLGWKGWVYVDEAVYNFYKE